MKPTPDNTESTGPDLDAFDLQDSEDAQQKRDDAEQELADQAMPQDDLQAQLADAEKRVLMAHADLDNFRRRMRRDHEEQMKYATLPLVSDLLDVLDNFDRAIESHENEAINSGFLEGVKMVRQQISDLLVRRGCKKIEAVGQPFDPNRHQALQMQPSDEFDANIVMADLRPGFEFHDRVVRPSQVFVSTGTAEGS